MQTEYDALAFVDAGYIVHETFNSATTHMVNYHHRTVEGAVLLSVLIMIALKVSIAFTVID